MSSRRPLAAAFVLACAASLNARAEVPVKPLEALPALQGLGERWTGIMDLFDAPGLAVAAVKDGVIYTGAFGVRDDDPSAPVTPETMFYIASITKTYTATGVIALQSDGKLSIDDTVKSRLSKFVLPDPRLTDTLTIRDLLSHAKGISSGPAVLLDAYTGEITEDRFWYWISRGQVAGHVEYTNPDYTIAGRVIEAVSGSPWRDYLQSRIFDPAGMNRTTGYASVMYSDPNSAKPLQRAADGKSWDPVRQRKTDRTMHAAGGLGTTAIDGARWLMLHINNGEIDGKRILPAEAVASMRVLQSPLEKPQGTIRIENGFGLAWNVGTFNDHPFFAHGGGYDGASAYMAFLPDDGIGIVILMNAGGSARGLGDIVAIDLLERLTGTKAAWDVYDNYTKRMTQMRAEGNPPRESENLGAIPATLLTRPIGQYTGWFRNEHFGTLIIRRDAEALTVSLGDAPIPVTTDPEVPNRFTLTSLSEDGADCEFIVESNGMINRIRLTRADYGEFEFTR